MAVTIDRTESGTNYDDLAEEILRLQEQTVMDNAAKAAHRERIQELLHFINSQPRTITEFDEALVKKLLDVYAARFGQRLEPLAIGGGTYARHMKNSVAFGIERPGEPGRAHMPDEYIPVNDLIEDTKTIADAIIALAGAEA